MIKNLIKIFRNKVDLNFLTAGIGVAFAVMLVVEFLWPALANNMWYKCIMAGYLTILWVLVIKVMKQQTY